MSTSILAQWDIDEHYFSEVVASNPSLRGMILGYVAERKLRDIFENDGRTEKHRKDDDHDRSKKGDLVLTYKNEEIVIEVKSLQTNMIQILDCDGNWIPLIKKIKIGRKPSVGVNINGKPKAGQIIYQSVVNPAYLDMSEEFRHNTKYLGAFQCDASDRRKITLDNGEEVTTTLLKFGEFDVIAAGIFSFRNKWEFGFALNSELPASKKYGGNSSHLIASLVNIKYPLEAPFESDPYKVFDKVIKMRNGIY